MPQKHKKRVVFISHAGADSWVAKRIADAVENCGAEAFLDESDIEVGDEFEERILESLEQADELVVLFTPWGFNRTYVWTEIGAAWYRRLPIVVILYGITVEEFRAMPNTPEFLKKRDMVSLNEFSTYTNALRQRAKRKK